MRLGSGSGFDVGVSAEGGERSCAAFVTTAKDGEVGSSAARCCGVGSLRLGDSNATEGLS